MAFRRREHRKGALSGNKEKKQILENPKADKVACFNCVCKPFAAIRLGHVSLIELGWHNKLAPRRASVWQNGSDGVWSFSVCWPLLSAVGVIGCRGSLASRLIVRVGKMSHK
jgi:hypothetical protein